MNAKKVEAKKVTAKKAQVKVAPKQDKKVDEKVIIHFQRKELQAALKVAVDFTQTKGSLPILGYVIIRADKRGCTITATDLEVSWSKSVSHTFEKGDAIARCVPAQTLLKEVQAMSENIPLISLVFNSNTVTVNNKCQLFTLPDKEFPAKPEVKGLKDITLPNLCDCLSQIAMATGDGDTRYTLNGVYLDFAGGKAVATDGHRLHITDIQSNKEVSPIIVPKRAVGLMIKYKSDAPLSISKTHVVTALAGGTMLCKLIEGKFPDYKNVIPKNRPIKVETRQKDLLQVLTEALPVASVSRAVTIRLNGKMEVVTNNPDIGHYKWHLDHSITGDHENLAIGLNAQYLIDALTAYPSEVLIMELLDPKSPVVINTGAVIMPIRLDSEKKPEPVKAVPVKPQPVPQPAKANTHIVHAKGGQA